VTDTFHQQATLVLLETFEASFEGDICSVCAAEKWRNSFFCRKCMIRLMRAQLSQPFNGLIKTEWMKWPIAKVLPAAKHWDLCRDYLISSKIKIDREEEV
jgi:ribosomal protein L40E